MINVYFVIIVSLLLGQFLFTLVIEIVNLINMSDKPPEVFAAECPPEQYKKSQSYLKENTRLKIIESALFSLLLFAMILGKGFNTLDLFVRSFGFSPIPTGLLYLGILSLGMGLFQLPFSIYDTFVIEEKYGFNRTTVKTFITDLIKETILGMIIGGTALAGLLWFFETMGPQAWIYCWIAIVIYQLVLAYIQPTLIMPLFNKFTPLQEGELKQSIENYAKEQNFALKGIMTMDNSQRSTKANAFFTGFGKTRRVVLFDTLISNYSVEELVSIFAHEVGHYKKKHILKMLLIAITNTGLMFFLLSFFLNNEALFRAFGMEHLSIYASFVFFGILYSPIQTLVSIFFNSISRQFEYEADAYAVTTYHKPDSFIQALKKLTLDNLMNLTPHPWKVAVSYSHPTVVQRIEAIKKMNP